MFARGMVGEIVIEHPNRDKASSSVVRLVVVAFLLVSRSS
jgi:hypothetical protein